MTAREELARVIVTAYGENEDECPCEQDMDVADAILAAGYRKPRTISTVEELKTVYEGSIIRDCHGDLWGIDGQSRRLFSIHYGIDELYDDDELDLPATVVYEEDTK